jgi:hypothetical protein
MNNTTATANAMQGFEVGDRVETIRTREVGTIVAVREDTGFVDVMLDERLRTVRPCELDAI